ncbi:hypothetical protein FACUT_9121 [Fusarium acutatum]|uniref:Uncharacterized protein n=1 Tax=Fusarium acutatum TaxID=78861 RepID=A0A8H4JLZ1_9HYPO|nr:hypothetical protein FACUT_9121 [Fusarium acutatum]
MMTLRSNLPVHGLRAHRYAETGPSHPCVQQHTPPTSDIGSPEVKIEEIDIDSQYAPCLASMPCPATPSREGSSIQLPSLEALDRGVKATAQLDRLKRDRPLDILLPGPSDLIAYASRKPPPTPRLLWSCWTPSDDGSITEQNPPQQRVVTGLGILPFGFGDSRQIIHENPPCEPADRPLTSRLSPTTTSSRDSLSPDVNSKYRSNQKYTTEEGDFIIYARHDRNMKWSCIVEEFATMFGHSPPRTIQGLQGWHYRMNNQIPVWDADGWLCFDHDDDCEPRQISIKSRERYMYLQPGESLGIAQRYPERAVHYAWVDPKTKLMAKDWAAKRTLQYDIRRRRQRKQLKRLLAKRDFN